MNIQIFGKNKCFGSRSAERFFKERKIKYQFINILEKGMFARELDNVLQNVKDIDLRFDKKSPQYESLNVAYITRTVTDKKELLLTNPSLLVTPIVRDCDSKKCTVGVAKVFGNHGSNIATNLTMSCFQFIVAIYMIAYKSFCFFFR